MYKKAKHLSIFRKVALGSWRSAGDPSVYGIVEVDLTAVDKFLHDKTSHRITASHIVGKAIAVTLREHPQLNSILRLGNIYQRQSVDVFFQVNIPGEGHDAVKKSALSGVCIRNADRMSLVELADALNRKTTEMRANDHPQKLKELRGELGPSLKTLRWVPAILMRYVLNVSSFFNYDLGFNLTWLGMPRDPFGSVMVTNVGSLGIEMAWAPLVPFTRVPILLTVGEIGPKPWVHDGKIEIRNVMKMGVTFDHRFIDGAHAAGMLKTFKACFAEPERFL